MDIKSKLVRTLSQSTCDKTELNRTVLKFKKRFEEAGSAIGEKKSGKKKK